MGFDINNDGRRTHHIKLKQLNANNTRRVLHDDISLGLDIKCNQKQSIFDFTR